MSEHLSTDPPRSRVALIVLAVVVALALIAVAVVATGALGSDESTAPSTSSSDSSDQTASQTSPSSEDGAGASGCLGGVNPTKAVLAAQEEASLDPKGAAAFAATVMRWRIQYPPDPAYEGKAEQIMTADAGSDLLTMEAARGGPEDSGWGSTDGARYRVTESSENSATVEIVMPFVVTSKEYPDGADVVTGARWRLVVEDEQWRVADMDPMDPDRTAGSDTQTHGLTFKGVC